MKKINFIVSLLFAAFAVLFTVKVAMQISSTGQIPVMAIASSVIMYFLSAFYGVLGFRISHYQKETIENHRANYRILMDMYEDISKSEHPESSPLKQTFCMGVHEFGLLTFDILTRDYPMEMQQEADGMLSNLMRCVARIT